MSSRSNVFRKLKMGAQLSKMLGRLFGNKEMRILMLGLDAAGKTSTIIKTRRLTKIAILYKLKLNQSVTTIPTVLPLL